MEVTLAVLADAANISQEGKLNLLGVFQSVFTPTVPCQHPLLSLVLVFKASPGERGTNNTIHIHFIDDDGRVVIPTAVLPLNIPADIPQLNPEFNMILNFPGLPLGHYGLYYFDILVNGDSKRQVTLQVQPVPEQG